jgi:ferric-dicitrate binding protein FerR (iron transport regulator)
VYVTTTGERERITLPDGTQFTLAPASTLRLAPAYGAGSRDVYVDGEAYFAVAHDAAHPFAVHAAGTIARDIGTQFDVRAYATDGAVRVAVTDGIVAVGAVRERDWPVRVGDVAIVRDMAVVVTHNVDVAALTSWTDGRLTFVDAPVADAARDMSRWYGVSIRMGDAVVGRRHISVVLTSPSADAALAAVAPAVGARVVRAGDAYVLFATPLPQQR